MGASLVGSPLQRGFVMGYRRRHEHPNIFVVNTQTYETYRFTVGDNVMLSFDGVPSDLSEARRTAIAFLAQSQTKSIPRR